MILFDLYTYLHIEEDDDLKDIRIAYIENGKITSFSTLYFLISQGYSMTDFIVERINLEKNIIEVVGKDDALWDINQKQ